MNDDEAQRLIQGAYEMGWRDACSNFLATRWSAQCEKCGAVNADWPDPDAGRGKQEGS